jgi:hypothetical protein
LASSSSVRLVVTELKDDRFRLSTASKEFRPGKLLRHPVSGSREFGFVQNLDGSITFYTQGVDTPNSQAVEQIGSDKQKEGWTNMMVGLAQRFGFSEADAKNMVDNGSYSNQSIDESPGCFQGFRK